MANPGYLRSTDGSDTDNGSTWALANATMAGSCADSAAGDVIYSSQVHAETQTGAMTITFPGTYTNPNKVFCANDSAEPPTTGATSATVTSSANTITIAGSAEVHDHHFTSGSGAINATITIGSGTGAYQRYVKCKLSVPSTGAASKLNCGGAGNNYNGLTELINTDVEFLGTGGTARTVSVNQGNFNWSEGTYTSQITSPTEAAFLNGTVGGRTSVANIKSVNMSSLASSINLVSGFGTSQGNLHIRFDSCKLPSSWSGSLVNPSSAMRPGDIVEMYNCDSGDTNYKEWVQKFSGSLITETTIVMTGAETDGTTNWSWKLSTTADAKYPAVPFESKEIRRWNDVVGTPITVKIPFVHDSVTALTDAEIALRVMYMGTSGFPLGVLIDDAKADYFATAASQASSSETWTTTGLTNPNKQELSVTFTPQEKGWIVGTIVVYKPSYTVYVDPWLQVS